jgi:phage replication O-like protein O
MSPNEFVCLTLIIRKTRGWNKQSDKIAISQFREFTGINREKTLSAALESLRKRGFIKVEKWRGRISSYELTDLFSELENAPTTTGKFAGTGKNASGVYPVDNSPNHRQIRPSTKGTYTKGENINNKTGLTKINNVLAINNPALIKQGEPFGIKPKTNEKNEVFRMRVIEAMSRRNFDAMQSE